MTCLPISPTLRARKISGVYFFGSPSIVHFKKICATSTVAILFKGNTEQNRRMFGAHFLKIQKCDKKTAEQAKASKIFHEILFVLIVPRMGNKILSDTQRQQYTLNLGCKGGR